MSLPPSSRCCRILKRRLRSPADGRWFSESDLSHALERNLYISGVSFRRHGSHVPGPLENRKRQDRRRMGALHGFQAYPSTPFWDLANSVDLTQWRWEPPDLFKAKAARREEADRTAPWDLTPDMSPARFDPETLTKEAIDSVLLDASIASGSKGNKLRDFCNDLQDAVAKGSVATGDLPLFLDALSQRLEKLDLSGSERPLVKSKDVMIAIHDAIMQGISQASQRGDFIFHEYRQVYLRLLDGAPLQHTLGLSRFERIISAIPDHELPQFKDRIASNIMSSLISLSIPLSRLRSDRIPQERRLPWLRKIKKIGGSMSMLNTQFYSSVLQEGMDRLVARQDQVSCFRFVRLAFLHMLVRSPKTKYESVIKACTSLESGISTEPFLERDLSEVFLAFLQSNHTGEDLAAVFHQVSLAEDSVCFATMGIQFLKINKPRYLSDLVTFLSDMGRKREMQHIAEGFRKLSKKTFNPIDPLANLAIGAGHPELALWMHVRLQLSKRMSPDFWTTPYAEETLLALLELKSFRAREILKAVGISPDQHFDSIMCQYSHQRPPGGSPDRCESLEVLKEVHKSSTLTERDLRWTKTRLPLPIIRHVRRVEVAATAFANAPHLSNREALNLITLCLQHVQRLRIPIPRPLILTLLHVITRDLAEGNPGRTSRFRWFLAVLLKETSTNTVLETGLALREWRKQAMSPQ
ncbi:hypothetical protein BX600DRAFT_507912 [Xylariales sp. PMI_506]|nr:hypothetical protein BX600DRAFT_507912 [Xylariales sp. PMI_506]